MAAVELPEIALDSTKSNFVAAVTTSAIDLKGRLVGFQRDFTFDERVITFESEPVQKAGLTGGNWNVVENVLPGDGPVWTLRVSAFSTDLKPLSGTGKLFELRIRQVNAAAGGVALKWAPPPDNFIFIDADLNKRRPLNATDGGGAH